MTIAQILEALDERPRFGERMDPGVCEAMRGDIDEGRKAFVEEYLVRAQA